MSKFEDNPFSDPAIDNPFADPAVQQVARSTNNATRGLDDYNPFDGQQNANQPLPAQQPTQPAIMQAVSPPPPTGQYTRPSQQPQSQGPPPNFTTADFQVHRNIIGFMMGCEVSADTVERAYYLGLIMKL